MASPDAASATSRPSSGSISTGTWCSPCWSSSRCRRCTPKEILEAKIELLQKTNMIDFAADIWKSLHGKSDAPPEMTKRRRR